MPQRSLSEWLTLLQNRHPKEIELGLGRIRLVARELGLVDVPDRRSPAKTIVTIAGTNGKGSCVAALQALLTAAGYRVACYTSPHLINYRERIVIDGYCVSDEAICEAFGQIERARGSTSLTYFEFGTLAALLLMARAELDVAILEVGLGGRLDAVNILDADIAIVTGVALDHQEWLGDDLNQIAAEKAAIARAGKPLICGDANPVAGLISTAEKAGAKLVVNGRDFSARQFAPLPETSLPSASIACALQATSLITGLSPAEVDTSAIGAVAVPGRFQKVTINGVSVVLDVAHNPQASALLADRLNSASGHLIAVVGLMADKDIPNILAPLGPLVKSWYFCNIPDQPRAADAGMLSSMLYNTSGQISARTRICSSPLNALESALHEATSDDQVVVFGSFFTVGPILDWWQNLPKGKKDVE
ncbi:Mur ligase family protein [uncultured Porticoccus sp.]|uniref:bifunctional folylpolyglutamate synthase/dihydrofolate synthase n=1 Tax=uncultured Porticoccus sp. TaxID=1256050 RepID=UPI0030D7B754|tara:strand:+ start:398 stop:1657 length:1260 start_codon:yes stop_codon:yes gene_type:complete